MPDTPSILEASVSGEEISPIVATLEETLAGVSRVHALVALTTLVLLIQHPYLTPDQVYMGVQDVSRYVCTWANTIDTTYEPITDKLKLN